MTFMYESVHTLSLQSWIFTIILPFNKQNKSRWHTKLHNVSFTTSLNRWAEFGQSRYSQVNDQQTCGCCQRNRFYSPYPWVGHLHNRNTRCIGPKTPVKNALDREGGKKKYIYISSPGNARQLRYPPSVQLQVPRIVSNKITITTFDLGSTPLKSEFYVVHPWKFNITPEKWWLEDYLFFGHGIFSGAMLKLQGSCIPHLFVAMQAFGVSRFTVIKIYLYKQQYTL